MTDLAGGSPAPGARVAELLSDAVLYGSRLAIESPQIIYDSGSPAETIYFIESGQVRLYQIGPEGAERLSDILGSGAWFGTAALTDQPIYGSRAQAVSSSTIWAIERDRLLDWLPRQPEAMRDLLRQLAGRLKSAQAAAARLVFDDCNVRLVRTLLEFSKTAAAIPSDQGVVLRITHQELADAVGAARETISLALTQLRRQNLLRTGRNRLTFNPQALRNFSENLDRESQRQRGEKEEAI
jgi:CRP/FNR family cyclic AMP-dependent transcriptional regulator